MFKAITIEKERKVNRMEYEIKVGALASDYMARYKGTDVVVSDVRYFVHFIAVDLSDGTVWFTEI